ncbi:uncharacterized protein [Ptychodera flava]|uniref:uncharacterized protein n=1 Tax=Ptychodera flava TaxID=63121 RepID=UPI00396A310E
MGTRLRKLVDKYKGGKLEDGKGLTGRNRLTNQMINAFQVFYGIALRNNKGNVEEMSRQTRAILLHYASTHDEPRHEYCPKGAGSCASGKRIKCLANRRKDLSYIHLHQPLSRLWNQLSTSYQMRIFSRGAQLGYTQNQNESLHNVMWSFVPKDKSHGLDEVTLGINMAVAFFNGGMSKYSTDLCRSSTLGINSSMTAAWLQIDNIRVRDALYKASTQVKRRRKRNKQQRLQKLDKFQYSEGCTYQPGAFDSAVVQKDSGRRCTKCLQPMKGHKRSQCS